MHPSEDFDFLDPELKQDPYPAYARLRDQAPLGWTGRLQAYVLSRYEDVTFVLKHPALFSSEKVRLAGRERSLFQFESASVANLVTSDPPLHTRLRNLVSRAFLPKRIAALEPRIRELARGLVEEMTSQPEFDFMDALASPLPVTLIAEMLGIEVSRRRDFKRWSDSLLTSASERLRTGQPSEQSTRNHQEMLAYMSQMAEERRRAPRGDLISALVQDSDGTGALTPQEVNSFAVLLLLAGNETTTNLLGNALLALLRHPEAYARLRRDPSPAACAAVCEETLRYDSPVLALLRRTTQAVEVSGGRIPAEATVLTLLGSANRDPRRFPDPERFDPQRDTQGLLSFGHGIHFCLGASLTRLEAPVALQELLERAPPLGLAPRQPERIDYGPSFALRGPRSLWLQAR